MEILDLYTDTHRKRICCLGDQPLSYTPSTASFSSASSSLCHPYTPPTRHSSPHKHTHDLQADCSLNIYDAYTPVSATSDTFFCPDGRVSPMVDLFGPGLEPFASTTSYSSIDSFMAWQEPFDVSTVELSPPYSFSSPIQSSPVALTTQNHCSSSSLSECASESAWTQYGGSSPINFVDSSAAKSESGFEARLSQTEPPRLLNCSGDDLLASSEEVQKARGSSITRVRQRKERHLVHQKVQRLEASGVSVILDDLSRHACGFPGCSKTYARKEHMKRHLSKHENPRDFQCAHCPDGKKIKDRLDNYITHLKLHITGSKRTAFAPQAQRTINVLEAVSKHGNRRKQRPSSILKDAEAARIKALRFARVNHTPSQRTCPRYSKTSKPVLVDFEATSNNLDVLPYQTP